MRNEYCKGLNTDKTVQIRTSYTKLSLPVLPLDLMTRLSGSENFVEDSIVVSWVQSETRRTACLQNTEPPADEGKCSLFWIFTVLSDVRNVGAAFTYETIFIRNLEHVCTEFKTFLSFYTASLYIRRNVVKNFGLPVPVLLIENVQQQRRDKSLPASRLDYDWSSFKRIIWSHRREGAWHFVSIT